MPIVGMTDQIPSFPQIGVIRKGGPKGQNRPGPDLTYFRVQFDENEVEAASRFREAYGEQPEEINILLPFDEIERCWEAWREGYRAGALIHRCDGEFVHYAINPNTGEVLVRGGLHVETGEVVRCTGNVDCRPHGRLRVIIPELRRVAYLMALTGSIHDIVNITSQLKALKAMNEGRLQWIPLVLRRRPKMISTPSGPNGKRARRQKWLLSIEADPRWVEAKLLELKSSTLPQLPSPEEEGPIEGHVVVPGEETEEEFIAQVLAEIPFYGQADEVRAALDSLGLRWDPAHSDELFEILDHDAQNRAMVRAREEQQSLFGREEEEIPF